MSNIPETVKHYFAAFNAHDVNAIVACFAADATVHDESRHRRGLAEIAAWAADVTKKYATTSEIIKASTIDDVTVVVCKVTGTFPGSPIELSYRFLVHANLVSDLKIG